MSVQRARECAEECVAISEELHNPNMLFNANVLLARIEAAEGRTDVAVHRLTRMLDEAAEDEQRAELHYRMWRAEDGGRRTEEWEAHRDEAVRLYTELSEKTPMHAYHQRIEELKAVGDR